MKQAQLRPIIHPERGIVIRQDGIAGAWRFYVGGNEITDFVMGYHIQPQGYGELQRMTVDLIGPITLITKPSKKLKRLTIYEANK